MVGPTFCASDEVAAGRALEGERQPRFGGGLESPVYLFWLFCCAKLPPSPPPTAAPTIMAVTRDANAAKAMALRPQGATPDLLVVRFSGLGQWVDNRRGYSVVCIPLSACVAYESW